MTDIDAFLPEVRIEVPACPSIVMKRALRRAAQRLCLESTLIRRENSGTFDITQGIDLYTVAPPTPAEEDVGIVTKILYNKQPLIPRTEDEMDELDHNWRTADEGTPSHFFQPSPTTIQLNRKPNESISDGFRIWMSVMPSDTTTVFDDRLFTHWREGVVQGALHFLFNQQGKAWSDERAAKDRGKRFNYHILRATAFATRSGTRKPAQVRLRPWV